MSQPSWSGLGEVVVGGDRRVSFWDRIAIVVGITVVEFVAVVVVTSVFGNHLNSICATTGGCDIDPRGEIRDTWIGIGTLLALCWVPPFLAWRRQRAFVFVLVTQAIVLAFFLTNAVVMLHRASRQEHCGTTDCTVSPGTYLGG